MFSDQLLAHFLEPRNVGELPSPAITIEAGNPACGDILQLSALFEAGRIVNIRYRVRGCTASIAAGSAVTELLLGRSGDELRALRAADIEASLGGLPTASKHAAVLCIDGVKALCARLQLVNAK